MERNLQSIGLLVSVLALCTGFAGQAAAAEADPFTPGFTLNTEARMQMSDADNPDLGTDNSKNLAAGAVEGRFKLTANLSPNALFYGEGRGVAGVGRGGFESEDTGDISNGTSFLELRQSYFQFGNLEEEPEGLRIGRQKMRDPYGIWWNQDFDAVKATYDTTAFKGFVAGGQDLFSYQTGTDMPLNDQDVARLLAEGSWEYRYEQFFETRLQYQDDHSGVKVGDIENTDDLDDGESRLVWGGVRAAGNVPFLAGGQTKTAYRFDLLGVTGNEDVATTGPSGVQRIVTGITGRSVRGWAFDGGVDVPVPGATPVVHLGYAYGSGDNDPAGSTDHAFRQSGLDGNFSRIGALTENTDNYGTVLRPELSNIHILSAGVTMPVLVASNVGAVYRYFRLADPAGAITAGGVTTALNGTDRELGQEIDLLFNMDVLKNARLDLKNVQDVTLRSSLGLFRSGDAYGTASGETAVRGLVELKVGF